jgi:hypothetical protein
MARTQLPLTNLSSNGAVLNTAGTAVDQANGMYVAWTTTGVPAPGSAERLVLYVTNTFAGAMTVTVRAGLYVTSTPVFASMVKTGYLNVGSFESGKGDFVTGNLTASTGFAWIGPLEVARFLNGDGGIAIDFSASFTGTIFALMLPRAAPQRRPFRARRVDTAR